MRAPEVEIPFVLPGGYRDPHGAIHREGVLRPATARDEMRALSDFRVHVRAEWFLPVVLARLIARLGTLGRVDAGILDRLPPGDLAFLEGLYREANGYPRPPAPA